MYRESDFFSINKKADWKEGISRNISVENDIRIREVKKYSIDSTIDIQRKGAISEILAYSCEKQGIVYFIDDNGVLWEYDALIDTLDRVYQIDEFKDVIELEVTENKIIGLFRNQGYYVRVYSYRTGQILREMEIRNNKKILDYYMTNEGNILVLDEDINLTWINIIENKIKHLNLNKYCSNNNYYTETRFSVVAHKENRLFLADKMEGQVHVLSLEEIEDNKLSESLINVFNVDKLLSIFIDRKGCLYINYEKEGQAYLEKTKDYVKLEVMPYLRIVSNQMKFDESGKIFIKSKDEILYIYTRKTMVSTLKGLKNYSGVYYSKVFDSQEAEMKWHKILIEAEIPKDTQIKIDYYAFDDPMVYLGGKSFDVRSFISSSDFAFEEKEKYFEGLWSKEIVNANEALFQRAQGRYIILRIELSGRDFYTPKIDRIRVYYNRTSYLRYLPEIYQANINEDDFLERYLSILESFYMEIEEKIDYVSNYFDIDNSPPRFLRWLCEWIGMDTYLPWDEKKLRRLIKRSHYIYKKRGTKKAIEEVLKIFLEVDPIIIENFKVHDMDENNELKKLIVRLYGIDPYSYTVLIQPKKDLTQEEIQWIDRILENESPAYCKYNFIILKPWIFLDKHNYLGINSCISGYSNLKLDGKSMLTNNAVITDTREDELEGYIRLDTKSDYD
ncbi:phage tail protein [Wukongibacter baidiensis]|uniref:phage tail protein n=1 Tax=Wukongibacter baidiensis TaxID=1723361 RepID=UPI003D7FA325